MAAERFGQRDFESFFHGAYYSNVVGHRKPEQEIYELVLTREGLKPDETFFVDDKEENVAAAKTFGIHAYQLKERDKLQDLLAGLDII